MNVAQLHDMEIMQVCIQPAHRDDDRLDLCNAARLVVTRHGHATGQADQARIHAIGEKIPAFGVTGCGGIAGKYPLLQPAIQPVSQPPQISHYQQRQQHQEYAHVDIGDPAQDVAKIRIHIRPAPAEENDRHQQQRNAQQQPPATAQQTARSERAQQRPRNPGVTGKPYDEENQQKHTWCSA
jgi:hypothetical protein